MKKMKYFVIVLLTILLLPFGVKAEEKEKINIYFFYGDGCQYCALAEEFFKDLAEDTDYKDLYNFKMYETWYDEANAKLMTAVGEKLGDEVSGVPYLIIGEESFNGYSSEMDEKIKKAIKTEYDKDERYTEITTLINESDANSSDLAKTTSASDTSDSNTTDIFIATIAVVVIVGFIAMIVIARRKTK